MITSIMISHPHSQKIYLQDLENFKIYRRNQYEEVFMFNFNAVIDFIDCGM